MSKPALDALWQDLALDAAGENPRLSLVFKARARRRKIAWMACCSLVLVAGFIGAGIWIWSRPTNPLELTPVPSQLVQEKPSDQPVVEIAGPARQEKLVDFGLLTDEELESKLGLLNLAVVGTGEDQKVIFLGRTGGN